jgi:predicted nucleic acid-binding protein
VAIVMDKIVIDSSVAIKWFIPQNYSLEANKILNSYQQDQVILLAPDLIYSEMGNIVWKMERFQGLENQDAQVILDLFEQMQFNIVSSKQLLKDAYQFAVSHQRSVYDSLYVVLSIKEDCKFITADNKLYNAICKQIKNIELLKDI